MIICGFAGIGKSYLGRTYPRFMDLESTPFEMEVLIVIILCLGLILGIYILIRSHSVCNFELLLNERCYEICQNHLDSLDKLTPEAMEEHQALVDVWQSIMDIPYEKFLFSFNPLKPEYWLTEKQLAFLRINKF